MMEFPHNKKFAFTIIDDTDGADLENVKPIYELLAKLGFRTTKTVWVYPSKDKFKGSSLADYRYRQFIKKLQKQGFEIALHGVGSGDFKRAEIIEGLETFQKFFGFPKIQINHAQNPDNLYWGIKRFRILQPFWRLGQFKGDQKSSEYFWGDLSKKQIKYVRNFTFRNINTLKSDSLMPYQDKSKPYVNYWFSSSDGADEEKFNQLTTPGNIERLKKEGGASIIYTHFASGFVKNGRLNRDFQNNLKYLARQDGWFVPAGELLDYLLKTRKPKEPTKNELIKLELKWLWDKFSVKARSAMAGETGLGRD